LDLRPFEGSEISKRTLRGMAKIKILLADSHAYGNTAELIRKAIQLRLLYQ
jgi:hypothetical protein